MNKKLYYLLNFTWGIPMTLVGYIACLVLIGFGKCPTRHGGCLCFEVGENWGGVSLGMVIIVSKGASDSVKNHEFGHSIQNSMFGVLMPFIVAIPSAVRYWYRRGQDPSTLPPYDAVWFEGQATELGNKYILNW